MAGGNVRVGVAYIDVRLGELKQFWGKLKREVEKNGPQVGKQLGDEVTKRLSVSKKDFSGLTKAISGAIQESGVDARKLKDVLRETGRQGGDAFLREFTPLLRASLAKSGIEGRERLLEAFEAGNISPRLVRTFQQALGGALEGVDTTAVDGGTRAGNAFASGFNRGVGRVSEGLGAFSQRLGLLSFQVVNLGVTLSAAFTAPVAALTALAGAVGIKSATIIEDATVAFTTLLGTQDRANAFLLTLRGFANTSPIFDLDNVIQFSRNLLGAGVGADRIIPTLTALSSIAAAYGLDQEQLNRALRGFTQSLLLGRVYQEELNQITEAGIPIYDLLAKAFGKTKQEIQELVSNKEISPEELFNQIVKLGNSGQFLAGLEQRAGTLTGVWQQFKETLQSNLADALTPQLPRIKEFLRTIDESLRDVLANSGPFFDAVLDTVEGIVRGIEILSDAYAGLTPDQREFVNQIILFASAAGPAVIAAGALAGAVSTLASGVAFVIGLLASPLGAAVVAAGIAIAGLAALFKTAYDNSEDFRATIAAIVQTAKDIKAELQPRLTELAAVVLGLLAPAFDAFRDIVVEKVLPALRSIAETVGPKLVTVVREIAEVALPVLIFAFSFFAAVIEQQVIPAMNQLIDVYRNNEEQLRPLVEATLLFAQVGGTILVIALGAIIIAVSLVIGYYAFLIRVIATVVDWVLRIARALGDLRGSLTSTGQAVIGLGAAFQRGVAAALQHIGTLLAAARGLRGRIAAAVGSLGGLLFQAGIDLIQGLINGVNARAGGLLGTLRDLAAQAQSIFGAIFQFGSPSKVTYRWGQWIVQGLEEGMSDAASTLAVPTPLANLAGLRIDEPDAPTTAPPGVTGADLARALQGVAVVLDGRAVGRIEGRRADLLYRGR